MTSKKLEFNLVLCASSFFACLLEDDLPGLLLIRQEIF